jgi:hypothetical protein
VANLQEEGIIHFSSKVDVTKQLFSLAENPALKEMLDLLVKKQQEQVAIKKKA